jgi:hypothetical protein
MPRKAASDLIRLFTRWVILLLSSYILRHLKEFFSSRRKKNVRVAYRTFYFLQELNTKFHQLFDKVQLWDLYYSRGEQNKTSSEFPLTQSVFKHINK